MTSDAAIIGTRTTYTGTEFSFLTGYEVQIVAVFRGDDPDDDDSYVTDDHSLARAGGVRAGDRVEVAPIIKGRLSFATSDPLAQDLECLAHLS